MVRSLLRSLAVAALLAAPAVAHDGCGPRFPHFFPRFPVFRVATPRFELDVGCRRPIHRHVWVRRDERVWVEPLVELRVVGYDACRRPIVRRVLVRDGYWSVRCVENCSCGQTLRR